MNKTNKPDMKITLCRDMFNALFNVFRFFESLEDRFGDSYHVHYSKALKAKIIKYGRLIKGDDGDLVLLYFFPNEAIQLIAILTTHNAVKDESGEDYFARFVENKKEKLQ